MSVGPQGPDIPPGISREKALARLKELEACPEGEDAGHMEADRILLSLINDPEITEAFDDIFKWYS